MTSVDAHDAKMSGMTSSSSLNMHSSFIMHDFHLANNHLGYVFGHVQQADDPLLTQKRTQMPGNTLLVVTETLGQVSLVFLVSDNARF